MRHTTEDTKIIEKKSTDFALSKIEEIIEVIQDLPSSDCRHPPRAPRRVLIPNPPVQWKSSLAYRGPGPRIRTQREVIRAIQRQHIPPVWTWNAHAKALGAEDRSGGGTRGRCRRRAI
ncbi:unnamed protein product [Zymoseptoria tritici ST99CH_1E4]|uniref:Uncharacterized protein n=1 Tax=Zymoseptoria tritici ST99CH_1E4 TaxID=1276532 RepID=A0A2H1H9V6_ZYMTR|nr:unnamed protein product [Zymoseptoria tritici ST99CH_1E4]